MGYWFGWCSCLQGDPGPGQYEGRRRPATVPTAARPPFGISVGRADKRSQRFFLGSNVSVQCVCVCLCVCGGLVCLCAYMCVCHVCAVWCPFLPTVCADTHIAYSLRSIAL